MQRFDLLGRQFDRRSVKINKILDAYYTSAPTAVYGSLASGRIVHDYLK